MATTDTLVINRILGTAAARKASDVHFITGNYPTLRIDGKLVVLDSEEVVNPDFVEQLINYFISKEKKALFAEQKEMSLVYEWMGQVRLKVKVFYQKHLPAVSVHLIPEMIPDINNLGLPRSVNEVIKAKKGLVVVGGTFGSGRSTTVASIIDAINNIRGERILTIEDPIEFVFVNNKSIIAQREVGDDVKDKLSGLKQALDQDFNIIMIDTVELKEEWELVFKHVEAGRLVIVTMTTESSISAIERIVNAFEPEEYKWVRELLANNIEAILIQRLLPRIGGGMIVAAEFLRVNRAIASSIKEDKLYQLFTILQTNRELGMISLDGSLMELIRSGEVNKEDAEAQLIDKNKTSF